MFPQICENWLKSYLMQVCKPCHYTLVEAEEPFKLHPMSMLYIYEVLEHLLMLWMGICLHTHTVTTTDVSPDLWKLAEILLYASMQTMALHGWGCRSFQTTSQVHVLHVWGVWVPCQFVGGHMASNLYRYYHRCFPRFVRVGWDPTWCKCANHATTLWLRLKKLSNYISFPWHTYLRFFSTFYGCWWAYCFTFTSLPLQTFPRTCDSWLKSYLMQVCKPCYYALVEAVEPLKLHPMSMSYMYELFKHLLWLLLGICLHTHTFTTADTSQDLQEMAKSLPYASVQTKPLHFHWGCRSIQTASYVHVIHIWVVWTPS